MFGKKYFYFVKLLKIILINIKIYSKLIIVVLNITIIINIF